MYIAEALKPHENQSKCDLEKESTNAFILIDRNIKEFI